MSTTQLSPEDDFITPNIRRGAFAGVRRLTAPVRSAK
jgi:hypothetical protein